jgi:hypothetical protein
MADNKEHSFDLITPADGMKYDPLKTTKDVDVRVTKKHSSRKQPVIYTKISRDFIKVDRNIIDYAVPFLMDRYSPGTTILYMVLYRMSYGYQRNIIKITDEDLSKKTAIPKRTLSKYRDELIEADLITYERGYKATRKPEYTLILPEQSKSLSNKLHKSANIIPKDVKSPEGRTIYNNIDKHAIVIEDMVRAFYDKIGKTQKYLTRKMLGDGIKTINTLIVEGYSITDIQNCIGYTLENKQDVYSLSIINYTMCDYLSSQATAKKQKEIDKKEKEKQVVRDKVLAMETTLMNMFDNLAPDEQNIISNDVELRTADYCNKHKIKHGVGFIRDDFMLETLKERFKEIVKSFS